MDDVQLINRCQVGDSAAFEELFKRYSSKVLRTAFLITRNRMVAEEVMQEAFIQTFQKVGQLREPKAFSSWLYKVTVQQAKRYAAKELVHRDTMVGGTIEHLEVKSPQDAVVIRQLMWKAIQDLPDGQRIAVVLHYYHDYSIAQIAEAMEAPEGTVKSWLHRAKSALGRELGTTFSETGGV